MPDTANLYLDLMKRTLTCLVYGQEQFAPMKRPANFVKARVYDALRRRSVMPMRALSIDREARINRRDWPSIAYTMIGMKRLENLLQCATEILRNNIPGDFIEAGTWRGGAAIFLRAILSFTPCPCGSRDILKCCRHTCILVGRRHLIGTERNSRSCLHPLLPQLP
jgi:hypothetical protein